MFIIIIIIKLTTVNIIFIINIQTRRSDNTESLVGSLHAGILSQADTNTFFRKGPYNWVCLVSGFLFKTEQEKDTFAAKYPFMEVTGADGFRVGVPTAHTLDVNNDVILAHHLFLQLGLLYRYYLRALRAEPATVAFVLRNIFISMCLQASLSRSTADKRPTKERFCIIFARFCDVIIMIFKHL